MSAELIAIRLINWIFSFTLVVFVYTQIGPLLIFEFMILETVGKLSEAGLRSYFSRTLINIKCM